MTSPDSTRSFAVWRWLESILVQPAVWKIVCAIRLVVHATFGRYLLPDGRERLRRARRSWEFCRARDLLPFRRPYDLQILSSITNDDEYDMVETHLQPDDVVLDIGAHIGGFSLLCHRRGSRRIFAFEPNPQTFSLLERNLAPFAGVHVDARAVFRSDVPGTPMPLSAVPESNTGAPTLLFGGEPFVATHDAPSRGAAQLVPTVALDEVLARFPRVRLLKLDCEGSEFPILLTSRELARVDTIVGEYHEVDAAKLGELHGNAQLDGLTEWRVEHLDAALSGQGFHVRYCPTSANLGIFHAVRIRSDDTA